MAVTDTLERGAVSNYQFFAETGWRSAIFSEVR
jgi:hypothetical protein